MFFPIASVLRIMGVCRTSLKIKTGPIVVNIDTVMEKMRFFSDSVHVKNYGCVQDIFENENWSHDR